MSSSSSFIATNCPDTILDTNLAVIGGRADDNTIATPGWIRLPLRLAVDTLVTSAGSVANDCTAPAACLAMTWLMVAMLAMADPGGRVPRELQHRNKRTPGSNKAQYGGD